ncbi:YrzI family small protein [Neobacillus sp. PS3-34]|nr:YrzI family small protein [Neobacillus sp. PS3-34]WML47442.1 YrzI family small protein [Neobacillus sp. PS3-34]
MTLNILFMTITIKKRILDPEKILRDEMVEKLHDEIKDRQFSLYRPI